LGDALFQIGHYDEALTKYNTAVEMKSDFYEAYVRTGDTYYAMYKLKEAEKSYKRAIGIRKDKILIYEKLAKVLSDSGKYHESIECYQKLIEIMPNNDNYFFGIAVALNELKDIKKAIKFFDKAIDQNQSKASLYYDKSWTCIRQSERESDISNKNLWIEKSLESLKRAIDIDPTYKIRAKEDSDFNPIRNNKHFQRLISG
jgi:tetratricopeptide (TPR) repeat protein